MKKTLLVLPLLLAASAHGAIIITELADPNNNVSARYVELYNTSSTTVDLAAENYTLRRWTNGNADFTASSDTALTGTIAGNGFYIIANVGTEFGTVYGFAPSQSIGTGGPADSNGDDQIGLAIDGTLSDFFGVQGEDGSGTWHEFEDGRAERKAGALTPAAVASSGDWNVDNDSGGGDGALDAPGGYDPGSWIGAVPEPTTSLLGALGLVALLRRRR